MTAVELIGLLNQLLFVGLFAVVLVRAVRLRTRASINAALLFGSIAGFLAILRTAPILGLEASAVLGPAIVAINLAPLAMLRLVDDFSDSPAGVQRAGHVAFAGVALLALVAVEPAAALVELASIAFFLLVGGYAALTFAVASTRTRGITSRRMAAVAIGALLFIGAIVALFVGVLLPGLAPALGVVVQLVALAAVVAFFLGFAPPTWMRRAWREPDLRRFLEQSVHVATMPDDHAAMTALGRAVADALGANGAAIGLADAEAGVLRYASRTGDWLTYAADELIGGRAFTLQERIVVGDSTATDPEHAALYQAVGARAVIAAPVSSDDRRLGVLTVYAERAPVFVEDDLWLLELLADQTGVLLEARKLGQAASQLSAREDAARLKEEFLSAAAHDLRTPLTIVLGQAELLERRLAREPGAPIDVRQVGRISREARRLRDLVNELLDVQRLEQGEVLGVRAPADVGEVVESVVRRHADEGAAIAVEHRGEAPIGAVDRGRLEQVIDNLLENALKYGGDGGTTGVVIESGRDEVRVNVIDHGMGIPGEDRERIFERFFRAANAHDRSRSGLGLGLYICRRIVEAHGGRIWHEPTPGGGSTFSFSLPLAVAGAEVARPEPAPDPGVPASAEIGKVAADV